MMMFAAMVLLVACGGDKGKEEPIASGDAPAEKADVVEVKHELDSDVVKVEKSPETVVVFDFGVLDTLDELDVEVAGLPKANIPAYLSKYEDEKYENLGSLKEPEFEKIHALKPDVIFISTRQADLYDQFSEIAPTVYVGIDYTNYMDSFKQQMNLVADIFDKEADMKEELAEIDERIAAVKAKATDFDKKALIILATEGKVSAYGPGSRFGFVHDVFGFKAADEQIEASSHGQNITFEYILEKNPDVLLVIDRDAAIGGDASAKESIENDLVKKTTAFQEESVYYLDPSYWYLSSGGLLSMKEMIAEIEDTLE